MLIVMRCRTAARADEYHQAEESRTGANAVCHDDIESFAAPGSTQFGRLHLPLVALGDLALAGGHFLGTDMRVGGHGAFGR